MAIKTQDSSKKTRQIAYEKSPDEILVPLLGDRFREYREKWARANTLEYVPPFPLELGFDLKFACNLKCVGCYFCSDAPDVKFGPEARKDFPMDKFTSILEQGRGKGLASVYFGYASEPAMNRRFLDYVQACKDAGIMDIWFGSNAVLLTEQDIDALIEMGVTRFLISIDAASKQTYDKVRVGGDFERVVHNIRYMARRKRELGSMLPLIRTSFVINSINQHEADDFVKMWENDAQYVSVQNFEDIGCEATQGLAVNETFNPDFQCPQPFQRLFIHSHGEAYPCCTFSNMYTDEILVGNAFEQGVEEIWHGEKLTQLRDDLKNKRFGKYSVCRNCAKSSF